jgi:hypothetical protein
MDGGSIPPISTHGRCRALQSLRTGEGPPLCIHGGGPFALPARGYFALPLTDPVVFVVKSSVVVMMQRISRSLISVQVCSVG